MLRRKIGRWLMRAGANLAFIDDSDRDQFKHDINHETWVYAMAGSGGHILGSVKPMCEFDTISVIHALKQGEWNKKPCSDQESYHTEKWNC